MKIDSEIGKLSLEERLRSHPLKSSSMAHPILPNLAPLVASLEWELPELAPLSGGIAVSVSLTPGCGPPPQPPTKAAEWRVFESFPNWRLIIGCTMVICYPCRRCHGTVKRYCVAKSKRIPLISVH